MDAKQTNAKTGSGRMSEQLVVKIETEEYIFWEYTDGKPQTNTRLWTRALQQEEKDQTTLEESE